MSLNTKPLKRFPIILKKLFICMHICLHKFMLCTCRCPRGLKVHGSPGTGTEGSSELPNVGAEIELWSSL